MTKYMIISCTTMGVPRITVRYTLARAFRKPRKNLPGPCISVWFLSQETRTREITTPRTTPISSARRVSSRVLPRPFMYIWYLSSKTKLL